MPSFFFFVKPPGFVDFFLVAFKDLSDLKISELLKVSQT